MYVNNILCYFLKSPVASNLISVYQNSKPIFVMMKTKDLNIRSTLFLCLEEILSPVEISVGRCRFVAYNTFVCMCTCVCTCVCVLVLRVCVAIYNLLVMGSEPFTRGKRFFICTRTAASGRKDDR